MKKIILALLSLVYLAVASGIVVGTHYCMGRITSSEYAYSAGDRCDQCGMKNQNGCCHTEFKIVKLSDDQQQVKANFNLSEPIVAFLHHSLNLLQPLQGQEQRMLDDHSSPPPGPGHPLYISNSVFRI